MPDYDLSLPLNWSKSRIELKEWRDNYIGAVIRLDTVIAIAKETANANCNYYIAMICTDKETKVVKSYPVAQ